MNDCRSRFEEIWPVPYAIRWDDEQCEYLQEEWVDGDDYLDLAIEWDARLDTFTRCQETDPMVGALVDDLISELDNAKSFITDGYTRARITCTIENAKQIMEQKK